jgi:UDP-N-acetylglucosamine--N-acetylmuramyl-(pentapeptide) pyrophosphoryl-undecaprenol N-acetylglucosamine transferase
MSEEPGNGRATVVLAAGGTGGHLFPALALAQELGRRQIPVDLVTDMRGDRYGTGFPARTVYRVPSATLTGRTPWALARTGATLARGVARARTIFAQVRPAVVVGFGGYPSFPPLVAARLRRIPTALHEQNAVLGRANRLLARHVDVVATSFETTRFLEGRPAARQRFTGNPVRDQVIDWAMRRYMPPTPEGPFDLLVFGGSQGARVFADLVPAALAAADAGLRRRLHVVQQAREEDVERVRAAYAAAGIAAEVAPFFADLPARMAAASLVVARSGASTVAELTVMGRPSLLVPLPHALDNDQLANATRLAEAGAARCLEQRQLTPERLLGEITGLAREPGQLLDAASRARALGKPDAVVRLADVVEELAGRAVGAIRPRVDG